MAHGLSILRIVLSGITLSFAFIGVISSGCPRLSVESRELGERVGGAMGHEREGCNRRRHCPVKEVLSVPCVTCFGV